MVGLPSDPLLARPVHELHVVVPVVLEIPVGVGREPVVPIAVEHDRVVVRDPTRAEQGAELIRAQEVPFHLVLQVLLPVEADGAWNMRLGIESRVLVDLDDANGGIVEVILDPLRLYQNVLRVVRHAITSVKRV